MMEFKWSFTLTLTWEEGLILWTSEGDQICMCLSCDNLHVNDIYRTIYTMTAGDIHGARGIVMSRNDETNARNDVTHGTLHEFLPRTLRSYRSSELHTIDTNSTTTMNVRRRDAEFFIILLSRCVDFKEKVAE